MPENALLSLSAIITLVPAALLPLRRDHSRDFTFWALLAVAVAGPLSSVLAALGGIWRTDLSMALWVTVAASMALFAAAAAVSREAWRLTPLVCGYMVCLAVLATVWGHAPVKPLGSAPGGWILVHIVVSVATYALVTIAAVAALAAFMQERALKLKQPTTLTRLLPSVADCEELLVRLLVLGEIVLAIGLATGMALQLKETGSLLKFDHKTVLTVAAFVVIGGLLLAHFKSGLRGRKAARIVLLAYLLLTLGYPGVKFVTDVLMV
ncbi:MAG TPA: cytochrome c biogenesis protein CcsA [Rhodospirillales bacterium]